jgi:hypothetical protein
VATSGGSPKSSSLIVIVPGKLLQQLARGSVGGNLLDLGNAILLPLDDLEQADIAQELMEQAVTLLRVVYAMVLSTEFWSSAINW